MITSDTVAEESVMHEGTLFHDDCIQLPTCQTQTDSFSPNQDECDDQNNICNSAAMYPSPFDKKYVTPQDFELLRVIGMGSFGKVLQVRSKHSQQLLAMKIISKRLLNKKLHYIENIHAEREILTKVRHPFVVTMHCSFQTREKLFIVMDFLAGGELFLRIGREGIFRENTARFYIAEIILALEHLHSKGILHRDLKPENILLGSDGHLCLTDFGLAKDFSRRDAPNQNESEDAHNEDEESRALTICGTQEYMAPEMIARKGYGRAADFWSLGCIFYEMLQGNPPFQSKAGAKDLFRKIMTERVRMPNYASANACKVLKGLLNRNATARLGAAKSTMFLTGGVAGLKQEELFLDIDWMKLERKEIEPPERFLVEDENDLRHFHDEFTQMNLPRSVKVMSMDINPPRRCKSDMFKGFSFVQDDFTLPDRADMEKDFYWNNIEEDGESVSECASSIFNPDEDGTVEKPPDKKKNHRKKKKNTANQIPSVTSETNSVHESVSNHFDTKLPSSREGPHLSQISTPDQSHHPPSMPEPEKRPSLELPLNPQTDNDEWETVTKTGKKSYPPNSFSHSAAQAEAPLLASKSMLPKELMNRNAVPLKHPGTAHRANDWREHKIRSPAKTTNNNIFPSRTDTTMWPGLGDQPKVQSSGIKSTNAGAKGVWAKPRFEKSPT